MSIFRCLLPFLIFIAEIQANIHDGKFVYFAYGCNLLTNRIHINCPSAVRLGIGKLENYQLDFNKYSKRWRGASATIAKSPGRHVWGAIWEIDDEEMAALDKQEGIENNMYFRHQVELILLPVNKTKTCWVYEQTDLLELTDNIEQLIEERRPSIAYLNTIIGGAVESNLPTKYQQFLQRIPHNGR